jgi:2-phosphosulfolactate phosphatase
MFPVRVHLIPDQIDPAQLRGGAAIAVDVLRASTTIVHALAAGASAVIPCEHVEEAHAIAAARDGCLRGGERQGVLIPGFDLANSPAEYTPERVRGRTIIFTTTNGTRALRRAAAAERIYIGCFGNLEAVCARARSDIDHGRTIHLVCAGIDGGVSLEDSLCAGAMVDQLRPDRQAPLEEAAHLVLSAWDAVRGSEAALLQALLTSKGGRNLARAGLHADIELCSRRNTHPLVPFLDRQASEIRLDSGPP